MRSGCPQVAADRGSVLPQRMVAIVAGVGRRERRDQLKRRQHRPAGARVGASLALQSPRGSIWRSDPERAQLTIAGRAVESHDAIPGQDHASAARKLGRLSPARSRTVVIRTGRHEHAADRQHREQCSARTDPDHPPLPADAPARLLASARTARVIHGRCLALPPAISALPVAHRV